MCANNLMSTAVTAAYLVLSPWLARTGAGEWLGVDVAGGAGELEAALGFMARHPGVWADVLGFAACGAVGQVFICTYFSPSPLFSLSLSTQQESVPEKKTNKTTNSLHALHLLLSPPSHSNSHAQNVHHDPIGRRLRPPPHAHASPRRRARLRRHRRRGCDRPPGETSQGGGEAEGG